MDDLVVTGVLVLTGLCIAAILLLFGVYSVGGLIYTAFVSGEYGVVIVSVIAILIAGSMYIATGFWLRKTDRI
jgi:hypothetical protein